MFSLCIPTMNRFDSFLIRYLPKYLKNDLIYEIIITDETGEDAVKIMEHFNDPKIKVFQNESPLGPFLNKLSACRKATQKWIALIDSDNFADEDYFETAKKFIDSKQLPAATILAPSRAKPRFDYTYLSGFVYTKSLMAQNLQAEHKTRRIPMSEVLMNTGNYILNKYLVDNIDITNESTNIPMSSACDVIYFNTLLFEQLDLHLYVVPDMSYEHEVHNGSIYLQTYKRFPTFNENVHKRYRKLAHDS
jgi:NDP-sugar pyrophosphorylase family protein